MSDNKQLDDFFKQSFSDYAPDVPPHIWDNIAAGKKKKKAGFFWLIPKKSFLTIVALLVAGIGGFIAFKEKSPGIARENYSSLQDAGKTAPVAVLKDNGGKDIVSAAGNAGETTTTDIKALPVSNNKITKEKPFEKVEKNNAAGETTLNGTAANTGELSYVGNKSAVPGNGKRGRSKAGKRNVFSQKNANTHPPVAGWVDDGTDDVSSNDHPANEELLIPYIEGGKEKIELVKESIFSKKTVQPTPTKLFEDCPGSASGNNYYIEAYVSPDYAFKSYSDTANSALVQKRKESLHFQSAFSAGIRYTRVFSNGMSIRAGFNYSQINEKFSYAQDNVVQMVYVINPAGDTTDSYYVRGTRFKNSYNHYRTIDVPVVVGYEMGNGNFHANINAGVMVNIYSWQKGETLDNNGTPVSITTGKDDNPYQYKTNVGVGFTSAVSLYYKFSERFHLLAEPYLRYNFSPMSRETISIQEKFTTIGLRLGIRMDIK
jgi:hypothetical protein